MVVEEKEPPIKALADCNDRKIVLKEDGEPDILEQEEHPNNGNPKLIWNPNHKNTILDQYPNIRVLKLNTNALVSIDEVKGLTNLLELQAKTNAITNLDFMSEARELLPYLQKVDVTANKITVLPRVQCNSLKNIILDENQIAEVLLSGHPSLTSLSMNKNWLTNCLCLSDMPKLESLSIMEQVGVKSVVKQDEDGKDLEPEEQPAPLETCQGMENLPSLKKLNLGGNKLPDLSSLPELPSLRELVLDGNPIAKLEDLNCLQKYSNLSELSMAGCAIADEKGDEFKKEVIIALCDNRNLAKVNGEPISAEDRENAMKEMEERRRAAEGLPPKGEEGMSGEEDNE